MTTEILTLTDFLLARIADDETNARSIQNAERPIVIDSDVAPEIREFSDPARVLAECEAKRRIVEMGTPYVLAWLARPYADHPDYREEWRP